MASVISSLAPALQLKQFVAGQTSSNSDQNKTCGISPDLMVRSLFVATCQGAEEWPKHSIHHEGTRAGVQRSEIRCHLWHYLIRAKPWPLLHVQSRRCLGKAQKKHAILQVSLSKPSLGQKERAEPSARNPGEESSLYDQLSN